MERLIGAAGAAVMTMLSAEQPNTSCFDTLTWLAANDQASLHGMMMSSAQNLPYDAGKWVMCEHLPNSAKYHLLTLDGTLKSGNESFSHQMEYGICLPSSCNFTEAQQMANLTSPMAVWGALFTPMLALSGIQVANITSTSRDDWDARLDTPGPWITIAFCSFLILLVAISTGLHVAAKKRAARRKTERDEALLEGGGDVQQPRAGLEKHVMFRAFSLIGPDGTWDKLWAIPAYKPTDCLNGLRALSMFWIILGHSFLMPEGIMGYQNPQDIVVTPLNKAAAEDNWLFMFVLSSQISVDSFFFLGGFLFSLLTVKELEKSRGRLNRIMALALRYLRLTPSLAFVMLVYYMIWPMLANGPFAPKFQTSVYRRCDISWWSELLYLHNFVPFDSDDVCMGWTWYLGDDMIFFIVGILLLPLYYGRRVVGWSAAMILLLGSTAIMGYLTVVHHLAPEALDGYHQQDYFKWAYSKPYTRIPAYLVGVVAAWILLKMEKKGITEQTGMCGPIAATLLWLFAIGLQTFIVCIPATDHGHTANSWSDASSFVYLTFSRTAWAVCWGILTFLCYFGQAPITNWILSHPTWTPFARLTYGAYLCHPLVIKLAAGSAEQYYNYNGMYLVYHVSGNILCAYSCAFVVWCLIERPMMTFTTALIKSKKGSNAPAKEELAAPGRGK